MSFNFGPRDCEFLLGERSKNLIQEIYDRLSLGGLVYRPNCILNHRNPFGVRSINLISNTQTNPLVIHHPLGEAVVDLKFMIFQKLLPIPWPLLLAGRCPIESRGVSCGAFL